MSGRKATMMRPPQIPLPNGSGLITWPRRDMTNDEATLMVPGQRVKDSSSLEGEVVSSTKTSDVKSFAIIGTRDPDEAQIEVATNLAFAIAWMGNSKVRTGAAYGIDQKA